jgi:spore germination protein GerM
MPTRIKTHTAAIVAVADLLEQYTEGGRVVSVMPAPWLEEYQRRKAEQAQQEQEQARQDFADILESVQMLTDEQIERAVFAISPTDTEKLDVARFFLQELRRRDEANALAVFRRWKRGENPEQPD